MRTYICISDWRQCNYNDRHNLHKLTQTTTQVYSNGMQTKLLIGTVQHATESRHKLHVTKRWRNKIIFKIIEHNTRFTTTACMWQHVCDIYSTTQDLDT